MSVQAISWALEQKTGSPSCKAVLITLANYANAEGVCYPGQQKIAHDSELGLRTVKRCLSELESAGFIVRSHRQRANGSRTSDTYILGAKFALRDKSKVPLCPIQGATVAPPIEEPLVEPSVKDKDKSLSKKRGSRIDPDWNLSEADTKFAVSQRLSPSQIQLEADNFRDYWLAKAGQGGVKLDWPATWRSWVRNSKKFSGKSNAENRRNTDQPSPTDRARALLEANHSDYRSLN